MEISRAIILGIIQGLTEFLPISSSGHLVIIPAFFKLELPGLALTMALHVGTLAAVVMFFRKDVVALFKGFLSIFKSQKSPEETIYLKLIFLLIVALVPSAIIGVVLSKKIDEVFSMPCTVSILLILNGFILLFAHLLSSKEKRGFFEMKFKHAIIIGLFQVLSLLPGISRSGSTISGGIFSGVNKEDAARFSFLLSIPTILGASLFELKDLLSSSLPVQTLPLLLGILFSFLTGIIAIKWLLSLIKKSKLYVFSLYCFLIGLLGLFVFK